MKRAQGITLIETMVAMALASFILLGMTTVFSNTQSVYRQAERIARLHENLRFAQATLVSDIQLANFWGRTHRGENIVRSSGARVSCRRSDVTAWALDVSHSIDANDEHYALPCAGTRPSENSDVLIVRHARPATTVPIAGTLQVRSNGVGGLIFRHPDDLSQDPPGTKVFDLAVNAYYVSARSNYDPGRPALRRLTLVHGVMQDHEIIAGISNLQVQLGLDTDADGRADIYVTGDDTRLKQPGNRVVSVRLQLATQPEHPRDPPAELTQTIFLRNAQPIPHTPGPT